MQNWEALNRELEKRGKAAALRRLAESEQGRKLSQQLDAQAIEAAAGSGDSRALSSLLQGLLKTEEGKALIQSVEALMRD